MREEIRAQVSRYARIAGAVFAVLYLCLWLCTSMCKMPDTREWMVGSEDLVWGRILSAQNEGLFSDDMFLRSWGEDRDRFINDESVESGLCDGCKGHDSHRMFESHDLQIPVNSELRMLLDRVRLAL